MSFLRQFARICREKEIPFKLDGARSANALSSQRLSPPEMTWKRGVALLSLGGTKNRYSRAEAHVFVNPSDAHELP